MNLINRLNQLINEAPQKIKKIPEPELSLKPAPDKWSKKEILGHLCDSAYNNHSRFVRAQFEKQPFKVIPYEQDEWVKRNNYQNMSTADVIQLWLTLNKQIVNVITAIPEDKLGIECELGNAAFREGEIEKTLLWLIEDYIVHMEYHLNQIIDTN